MAVGPGKYDDLCTLVRLTAGAAGAVLIVIDGVDGSGFEVQANAAATRDLPDLLESVAAEIRRDGYHKARPQ